MSDEGGSKTVRNLIGLVVLLAVIGCAVCLASPWGLPECKKISDDPEQIKQLGFKWEKIADKYVMPKLPDAVYSPDELNMLFKTRILAANDTAAGAYVIEDVRFEASGDRLTVYLYTKFSQKIPVLFTLKGTLSLVEKKIHLTPSEVKVGLVPMLGPCEKIVTDKYACILENPEIHQVLERARDIQVVDGNVVISFGNGKGK